MLSAQRFDIAFLDTYYSSGAGVSMTGLDVTRAWRRVETARAASHTEEATRLPIVGCTANAGLEDDVAILMGQDRVWGKPIPSQATMAEELGALLPSSFFQPAGD